ncbi:MAG: hypothetical protein J5494_09010, partial [Candidatus Methanomethylophilaceae archaeon]|nr:hypothetical protein [Candidatus Methanomethylophilaceae archaeon]
MGVLSFDDIRKYRICPHAYHLSAASDDWRITLDECVDTAVRRTLARANSRRVVGHRVSAGELIPEFREEWAACLQEACSGEDQDVSEFFRRGEECIRGFAESVKDSDGTEIVSFDVRGIQTLPGGKTVRVSIDEIYRRGSTAVVCRYVTRPDRFDEKTASEDAESRVSAMWASGSFPGLSRIVLQWKFLPSGTETECVIRKLSMDRAAEELSDEIGMIQSDSDFIPRPGRHCRVCPYRNRCDSFISGLGADGSVSESDISALLAEYADLDEKIEALKQRTE